MSLREDLRFLLCEAREKNKFGMMHECVRAGRCIALRKKETLLESRK